MSQYLSFKNYLNIPFPIALKRGWRLVLEKSFKKNTNTEVEIEIKTAQIAKISNL